MIYKSVTIEKHLSGWYSAFIPGHGNVKADTLGGIKRMITKSLIRVSDLPVMKTCCKTCPFKTDAAGRWQDPRLAEQVINRNLFKSQQICHGTEGPKREPRNRCRGYYDYAFEIYKRLNLEPEKYLK